MKKIFRLVFLVLAVLVVVLSTAVPCYATVANPISISIPSVRVFQNVFAAGDELFIIETYPAYTSVPTQTPQSTFFTAIYDTSGIVLQASRPLDYYNHYFSAIYLTAAQAITWGLNYQITLSGNPTYFATLTQGVNITTYTLSSAQWVSGTLGPAGTTPSLLQSWCIQLAIACNPAWLDTNNMLTSTGEVPFLTEIPALGSVCPTLFETSASYPGYATGTVSKTEETNLTARQGTRLQVAMTNLGIYFGMGTLGGPILEVIAVAILVFMVAGGIFAATGNPGISVIVGVIPTIFAGNLIGLLPLTITFVLAFIVVLTFSVTFILGHL